jgi:hypothetical protein
MKMCWCCAQFYKKDDIHDYFSESLGATICWKCARDHRLDIIKRWVLMYLHLFPGTFTLHTKRKLHTCALCDGKGKKETFNLRFSEIVRRNICTDCDEEAIVWKLVRVIDALIEVKMR